MDIKTREALWQVWVQTDYVGKHYPKVADSFSKSREGDFATFIEQYHSELIPDLMKNSPYTSGSRSSKPKKAQPLGSMPYTCVESEIMPLVSADTKTSATRVKKIIDAYWGRIMGAIYQGKDVKIQNVGTFRRSKRQYVDNLDTGKQKETETVRLLISENFKREALGKK